MLLEPPVNVYRLGLHPEGLAPRVLNMAEYSSHLLTRLQREVSLTADAGLAALLDEVRGYPNLTSPGSTVETDLASMLFMPMRFASTDGTELTFFSTLATFGTALDITVAELSIEAFFPADAATQEALRARASLP
jgi:hypothetical protein